MACARVLSFRILAGREGDVNECLIALNEAQRQAEGYICRVTFVSNDDPNHRMIVTIWEDKHHADAFALREETAAHMSHIKMVSDELPIEAGEYDVLTTDPEDLVAAHRR